MLTKAKGKSIVLRYHPHGLKAAKECAKPDTCIFCEERLPPQKKGRKRYICGRPGCLTSYSSAYSRDWNLK